MSTTTLASPLIAVRLVGFEAAYADVLSTSFALPRLSLSALRLWRKALVQRKTGFCRPANAGYACL